MNNNNIKNISELEFAIFCIENVAKRLNAPAEKVYTAFTDRSSILYDYIVSEYEILII